MKYGIRYDLLLNVLQHNQNHYNPTLAETSLRGPTQRFPLNQIRAGPPLILISGSALSVDCSCNLLVHL